MTISGIRPYTAAGRVLVDHSRFVDQGE